MAPNIYQGTIALVAITAVLLTVLAYKKSKKGQFYTDTPYLFPFGIYIWGDGLVLGPFWLVCSLLFLLLSPINAVRFVLLFLIIRASYETIYWLVHQSSNRTFTPLIFRTVKWLGPAESAILFQLINTTWVILFSFLLLMSFVGN
jgi:hypothetical protein